MLGKYMDRVHKHRGFMDINPERSKGWESNQTRYKSDEEMPEPTQCINDASHPGPYVNTWCDDLLHGVCMKCGCEIDGLRCKLCWK